MGFSSVVQMPFSNSLPGFASLTGTDFALEFVPNEPVPPSYPFYAAHCLNLMRARIVSRTDNLFWSGRAPYNCGGDLGWDTHSQVFFEDLFASEFARLIIEQRVAPVIPRVSRSPKADLGIFVRNLQADLVVRAEKFVTNDLGPVFSEQSGPFAELNHEFPAHEIARILVTHRGGFEVGLRLAESSYPSFTRQWDTTMKWLRERTQAAYATEEEANAGLPVFIGTARVRICLNRHIDWSVNSSQLALEMEDRAWPTSLFVVDIYEELNLT